METRVAYPIQIKEISIQMKQENIPVKIIIKELGTKKHKAKRGSVGIVMMRITDWFSQMENNMLMEKVQKINQMNISLKNESEFLKKHIDVKKYKDWKELNQKYL